MAWFQRTVVILNPSLGGGTSVMWSIHQAMVDAGWLVMGISTGSVFNNNNSTPQTDQWQTTNSIGASGWVRLRAPVGVFEFVIWRNSGINGTNDHFWQFQYSKTGFNNLDAGLSAPPTATDTQYLVGAPATFNAVWTNDTTHGATWYCVASSTAPYSWCMFGVLGTTVRGIVAHDRLVSGTTQTGDTDPALNIVDNGVFPGGFNSWAIGASPSYVSAWTGPTSPTYTSNHGLLVPSYLAVIGSGPRQVLANGGADAYAFKDILLPVIWCDSINNAGTWLSQAVRGISSLFLWNGQSGRNPADTYTSSATRDRIVVQSFSMPWNGSVPAVP